MRSVARFAPPQVVSSGAASTISPHLGNESRDRGLPNFGGVAYPLPTLKGGGGSKDTVSKEARLGK